MLHSFCSIAKYAYIVSCINIATKKFLIIHQVKHCSYFSLWCGGRARPQLSTSDLQKFDLISGHSLYQSYQIFLSGFIRTEVDTAVFIELPIFEFLTSRSAISGISSPSFISIKASYIGNIYCPTKHLKLRW